MTSAEEAARRNWETNVRALAGRQARLARELRGISTEVEWVFGRDGALTARELGNWWSGSSLPRQSAQRVLAKAQQKFPVGCFVWPTHAQQIRVAMDLLSAAQALIAVVPDNRDLRIMLECEDFAREIAAGRLWFAWGSAWANELSTLLQENEGLPVPGQMIRTNLPDPEKLQAMVTQAQDLLGHEAQRRAQRVEEVFAIARPASATRTGVAVVAPSMFRLWDDAGGVLARIARAQGWTLLDSDDPTCASSVALARAAAPCKAMVIANAARADLPQGFPADLSIITWLTGARIPRFDPRGASDVLLVTEADWMQAAVKAGWPVDRVRVAQWPVEKRNGAGEGLAIIADTSPLDVPEFELSSHALLWENIAAELLADPTALGDEINLYISMWLQRSDIAEETLDRRFFIERLIVPAYQQGIVRALMAARLPVKLYGRGWDAIPEFRSAAHGAIASREDLRQSIDAAAVLVHAWPCAFAHPIDTAGRPVLRRTGLSKSALVKQARRMLDEAALPATDSPSPTMSAELLRQMM